jgi:hypothetical protein
MDVHTRLGKILFLCWIVLSRLNLKVLVLVRDPRGTMESRRHRDWCPGNLDCDDPAMLCSDMVDDFRAAEELVKRYPGRIRFVENFQPTFLTHHFSMKFWCPTISIRIQMNPWITNFLLLVISSHKQGSLFGLIWTWSDLYLILIFTWSWSLPDLDLYLISNCHDVDLYLILICHDLDMSWSWYVMTLICHDLDMSWSWYVMILICHDLDMSW